MIYDEKEIQKLIDNLDIVQVIGEYVNLKKAGSNYKGLSPFKDEKTPSFTVSPVKNIFKDSVRKKYFSKSSKKILIY